jgi:RNA polymerase sigma-70 factor, ECF subfamily
MVTTDDRATFTALFDEHRGGVHAFLLGRTSDPEAARDLLQETFLRVWRRVDEVAGLAPDRQRAWIFTVARNLVIDRYRTEATGRATMAAVADQVPDVTDDTVAQVVARDQLAAVRDAIGSLPDEQRTILTMATVGEMTSRQIAAALGMPPGTVRYELHRARRCLADRLEVTG